MSRADWRVGSKLVHPYDTELGIGVVRDIEDRYLEVHFPEVERTLTLAAEGGLSRLVLQPGQRAVLLESDEEVEIERPQGHSYQLVDGRVVSDEALWPLVPPDTPVERVATLRIDPLESFRNRMDGLELMALREAGGLGSFLGGRIELFPHQLHTALQAVKADPVRWLLADEVGLGKTIEAGLILSALVRTGRCERAIVVAPDTLAVQWLSELYGKFHQVFILLDEERLEYTAEQFGEDFNPFFAHQKAVVSYERLLAHTELLDHALAGEPDLIAFDEAHRLSDAALGAAFGPLVRAAQHALLLTATPLQADHAGFYALLDMLHPDAFASFEDFERKLRAGAATLACTSSVRRSDLGGLPPRVPEPVDLPAATGDLASDPRAAWLAEHAPRWRAAGEKVLVFVHSQALDALRDHLERRTAIQVAVFSEHQSLEERDLVLARFRDGPAPILLSTEAGGEGRNFQFCERMVHFDLPRDPVQLEQRIGRLDRIGRALPVEIVYFRCADADPDLARLYERLELFSQAASGIDIALARVREEVAEAVAVSRPVDADALAADVARARAGAASRAPRAFYPDAYEPAKAGDVLALVPEDLDRKMQDYCVAAAEDLGLIVQDKGGVARHYLEFGPFAKVESLPGVSIDALPGYTQEARFLGTFDRQEALDNTSLAFFSSGQMMVEGLILELEDGVRGRAALFDVPSHRESGAGLLCIYKDGAHFEPIVVDADGELRPAWAKLVMGSLAVARPLRPPEGGPPPEWVHSIRALGRVAAESGVAGRLHAAAYFRFV